MSDLRRDEPGAGSSGPAHRAPVAVRRDGFNARRRTALGIVTILAALLCAVIGRIVSNDGHHAYNPGVRPLAGYRLTLGKQYQLSSAGGVRQLTDNGLLGAGGTPHCFSAPVGTAGTLGQPTALSIVSTQSDERDLHLFATFRVGQSGTYKISCAFMSRVFVDDADNSAADYSAVLIVLAIVVGVCGVGVTMSGFAGRAPPYPPQPYSKST